MVARVLDEEDRRMLEMLREHGLDEEAQRYEARLRDEGTFARNSKPVPGAISIAEAADKLGLKRKEIRRHAELGLLAAQTNPETGESLITNTSIAWLLDARLDLAKIVPFPWEADEPIDPNSLLGQMMGAANRLADENEEE